MSAEDQAAEEFVNGKLTQACTLAGLGRVKAGGVFSRFETNDKLIVIAHAASLGSAISVTCALEGTDIVRTMVLTPEQAESIAFIRRYLISWVLNGGQHDVSASDHMEGIGIDLQSKVVPFLDGPSKRNLRLANRSFLNLIPREAAIGRSAASAPRAGGMSRFAWRRLDIA